MRWTDSRGNQKFPKRQKEMALSSRQLVTGAEESLPAGKRLNMSEHTIPDSTYAYSLITGRRAGFTAGPFMI